MHSRKSGERIARTLALVALATIGTATAAAPDRYFSISGVYTEPDSNRNADYGLGYSLGYGFLFDPAASVELRGWSNSLETGPGTVQDFYQYGLGVDLVGSLGNPAQGHFFGAIGGGGVRNDVLPNSKDDTGLYGNVALGWRGAPLKNWSLRPRLEVRGTYDAFDGGQTDVALGVGIEILPRADRIVERERIVEKTVEVPKIVEKVVEVPKEVVKEVMIEPVDSDGDGIYDARDKCPNTLKGAKVDANGCVVTEQTITLPNIEFKSGKALLTDKGEGTLEAVLRFLESQPEVGLEIVGHTDSQGPENYNLKLSQDRARSVLDFLAGKGIASSRLTSKGMGESKPIASNATAAGRAKNRRVELNIKAKK